MESLQSSSAVETNTLDGALAQDVRGLLQRSRNAAQAVMACAKYLKLFGFDEEQCKEGENDYDKGALERHLLAVISNTQDRRRSKLRNALGRAIHDARQ